MLGSLVACAAAMVSGFGLTESDDYYTIDTGADLVFQVRRTDLGHTTTSAGGINSIVYKGVEYMEEPGRDSHINSGFDWLYTDTTEVTVNAVAVGSDIIKITVVGGQLTHYYIVKKNEAKIYMGTHWSLMTTVKTGIRFLFRLNANLLPDGPPEGDVRDPTDWTVELPHIESADVFGLPNGETRSKHYTNKRMMDWKYFGATGTNVGMWIVRATHEGGSGGPFYRSTQVQTRPDTQELTYILNYEHTQTEDFRTGNLWAYTFVVNDGAAPATDVDYSFYGDLDLVGYVPSSGRGAVYGFWFGGRRYSQVYTLGFRNSDAQYWAKANIYTGGFMAAGMRPGTYEMTVFSDEYEVYTSSVVVTAGETTVVGSFTITEDPAFDSAIFRIGDWDGTPLEYRNGDKVNSMHPSDVRMQSWTPGPFVVGSSTDRDFPCYMWKDINNHFEVLFKMTEGQMETGHTVRIGITATHAGGRPSIKVNEWESAIPASPVQPKSRSLTTGSYRANNAMLTYDVPATAWNTTAEYQVLTIIVQSGKKPVGYLSPGISIDCVDLLA
ncbi:Rhamnogalacturonate lyase A [Diplonema papillatum]|nr:Rhamnogalacturonate lyase A [Diplonema papillatum]